MHWPSLDFTKPFGWRQIRDYYSADFLFKAYGRKRPEKFTVICGLLVSLVGCFLMIYAANSIFEGNILWEGGGIFLKEKPIRFLLVAIGLFFLGFFLIKPWAVFFKDRLKKRKERKKKV